MDQILTHELAIAYAHAKLINSQAKRQDDDLSDSEVRSFLKSYYYALHQLPVEDKDLDDHF